MERRFRLSRPGDVRRVRRSGKSYAHPLAVVIVQPNGLPRSRFSVTAGRVLGGAVHRNRAKRRLREVLRRLAPTAQPGWDIVVVARSAAETVGLGDLGGAIARLLVRGGVIPEGEG